MSLLPTQFELTWLLLSVPTWAWADPQIHLSMIVLGSGSNQQQNLSSDQKYILPSESKDPVYGLHRSFFYTGIMYIDLRNAIRSEEGQHIIRLWKHWSVLFLALSKCNHSKEAMNLLANINASYPKWLAYIVTHNWTVNTHGKAGHGKPTWPDVGTL